MSELATQRAVLDAIGIEWYVRRDHIAAVPLAPSLSEPVVVQARRAQPIEALAALVEPVPEAAAMQASAQHMSSKPKPTPPIADLAQSLALEPKTTLKPKTEPEPVDNSKPKQKPPQRAVLNEAPFNWLVAESERLLFVCDIKQASLNGVWHAAALELLGDIAIAMRCTASLQSRYFNWPILTPAGQPLHGVELEGFLSTFFEPRHATPIFVALGETAQRLAKPFVSAETELVCGPSLGELFTQTESKKALWQQLKPLR